MYRALSLLALGAAGAMTVAFMLNAPVGMPQGAIAAFEGECPAGWSAYSGAAGKVLLGAGSGKGLTAREVGQTGGSEPEAPLAVSVPRPLKSADENGIINPAEPPPMLDMEVVTKSDMPPFVVVMFCEFGNSQRN